ncbi:methionine--tRNA ligase, partial [Candidatus Saccharibacteria bacterium]|nr:methionine--tRNA ligase [Candidatus Saccharibacteria bacterium]
MKQLYVTTAIPYVNGKPHIGHALDYLLADVFSRYKNQQGNVVRFQSGTDEHGNKVAKKAAEAGKTPKEYADENSAAFRDFIEALNVHPTDFIRTTDKKHIELCQKIWQKLSPHIYSATYDGFYCEGCEAFVTKKEFDDNRGVCPDHGKPYQKISEENYYFRLSDFKSEIRAKIESDEMKILPEFRKKEVLNLLDNAPDVSISRPKKSLTWGIPVPGDDSQVMYVWLDALSNYLTVLGYPDADISDYWPPALQIVGKDILRFHAIIWPAMLLGLNLELPKVLLSHGYILVNSEKMSKSLGNVIDPVEILNLHGPEAFCYFFLR